MESREAFLSNFLIGFCECHGIRLAYIVTSFLLQLFRTIDFNNDV